MSGWARDSRPYRPEKHRDFDNYSRGRERESRRRSRRSRSRSDSSSDSLERYRSSKRKSGSSRSGGWDKPPSPGSEMRSGFGGDFSTGFSGNFSSGFGGMSGQSNASGAMAAGSGINKQAKKLYVGNLPDETTESGLMAHFESAMRSALVDPDPYDAVISVYLKMDKRFGFVEFRTPELATAALALDSLVFMGYPLKVRRPSDYNSNVMGTNGAIPRMDVTRVGLIPSSGGSSGNSDENSLNKVFIGGVPFELREMHVREILQCFGPIKSFSMLQDRDTGLSRGYGFVEWQDPAITDYAIACLNGIEVGERTLAVRRYGSRSDESSGSFVNQAVSTSSNMSRIQESNVICLLEMVTRNDLMDDREYEEIKEDIQYECSRFGRVLSIQIPRPNPSSRDLVPGEGKVFVEFENVSQASAAKNALQGRKFASRIVIAQYFSPQKYINGDFS